MQKWLSFITLLAIVVALSSVSQRWIRQNFETIPPPWDQSLYLYMAYKFWHALMDGGLPALAKNLFSLVRDRPPLVPLTTLPFFMVFGFSLQTAYMTNALYLFVLLASVFQIGCLLRGWKARLIAAFVCATLPALINYSRDYLLDFPMAAVISVALYTLLRSDLFRDRWYSFAFGLSSGRAVLTKPMAIAYLAPLFMWTATIATTVPGQREKVMRSLGLALAALLVVAGPWCAVNFTHAFGYLLSAGFGAGSAPYRDAGPGILSWSSLTYYPRFILGYGLSLPYAILFLGLLSWKAINKWPKGRWKKEDALATLGNPYTILGVWLLTAYVILTATPNKNFERYALPLLPAIAVLIGCWVDSITSRTFWRTTTAVTGAIGLLNYWSLTFGLAVFPTEIQWSGINLFSQRHHLRRWFYSRERWPIAEALATMASQVQHSQRSPLKVYVVPDHPVINSMTLRAFTEENRYPFSFITISEDSLNHQVMRSFDMVILKTRDQGALFTNPNFQTALRIFPEVQDSFTLLRRLPLPDDSELEIYVRKSPALSIVPSPMRPTYIVYGDLIELIGYDLREAHVRGKGANR